MMRDALLILATALVLALLLFVLYRGIGVSP